MITSFLMVLSLCNGRLTRASRLITTSGTRRLNISGIMKPTSRTIWCKYPSPRKTFCTNWSTLPAMIWSKATPTMQRILRVVTLFSLLAKWRTNVVENNSVSCEKRVISSANVDNKTNYREKGLVIPLRIEVVVDIIEIGPPCVIMGENGKTEQERHRITKLPWYD